MTVVVTLLRRVDANTDFEADRLAASLWRCRHLDGARLGILEIPENERFATGEAQRLRVLTVHELAGDDAHADEIRAMDALEAFRDDGFNTEQHRTFGGPIA